MSPLLRSLKQNLAIALSLISFRRVRVELLDTRAEQMIVLALLALLAWFCTDRLSIAGDAVFNIWGLHSHIVLITLSLVGAWLVARFAGDRLHYPSIVVLSLGGLIYMSIAFALVTRGFMAIEAPHYLWKAAYVVFTAWIPASMFRVVNAASTMSWSRTGVVALSIVAITGGIIHVMPQTSFWYPATPTAAEAVNHDYVNVETTYYKQHLLLNEQTKSMRAGVPGVDEYFFVGFGSYADQDVFSKEIQSIRELFDTRFDTANRSIALINNNQTADQYPIASISNLRIALDNVADKMDTNEDVLFLYLTSHGTADNLLAVDFYPLNLNQLTPETLSNVLDESDIKWRVVVVSACYSGGFVEALQDDNTLVITASAADRVSFGCTHENEYTWFGEAFFDEALRTTYSIADAFEIAEKNIRAREKAHEFEPSMPQIAGGRLIHDKLAAMARSASMVSDLPALNAPLESTFSVDVESPASPNADF